MKVSYGSPVVKETPAVQEEKSAPSQSPPLSDYMVVAEQNVFHPERKIPPENRDEKALLRPDIFLYGTLITGEMRGSRPSPLLEADEAKRAGNSYRVVIPSLVNVRAPHHRRYVE